MHEAKPDLRKNIILSHSIKEAVKSADAVLITTEWKEILEFPSEEFAKLMKGTVLFDTVNQYSALTTRSAGLTYIGVGHSN
jgi:UDPglucose 6-dehydrogenase